MCIFTQRRKINLEMSELKLSEPRRTVLLWGPGRPTWVPRHPDTPLLKPQWLTLHEKAQGHPLTLGNPENPLRLTPHHRALVVVVLLVERLG